MTNRRPQAAKPFDLRRGKSRRKEWGRPEPYRTNGVVLAPRRALAAAPILKRPTEDN
jgi:hypothetical protein